MKTPLPKSLFNKVADLHVSKAMVANLLKNDWFVCKSTGSEKSFATVFHKDSH